MTGSRVTRRVGGRAWVLAAAAGATVLAAAGCDWFRGGGGEGATPVVPTSMVPDVPVPEKFVFQPDKSNDQTVGGVRVVVHLYRSQIGSMKLEELADFYRTTMPAQGWSFVEEEFAGGKHRLMFKKGTENCFISIWKSWYKHIMIQIYPVGGEPPMPPAGAMG